MAVGRHDQLGERLPERFAGGVPEDVARGGRPFGHPAVGLQQHQCVGVLLEQQCCLVAIHRHALSVGPVEPQGEGPSGA